MIHSKDLRKPRAMKTPLKPPGSPLRARRVPLVKRQGVAVEDATLLRRNAAACDMLTSMEKALSDALGEKRGARSLVTASDVLDYGREMGWM
jgi:hypothetical protein